jgi:hypothetical protein
MVWCPLNKGVINLYRYRAVSLAANGRYLEALSVVDNPAWAYRQVEELTKPVVLASRSHAGFDPASGLNVKLFGAVLDGDHLVRGQSHALGRMLNRLHLRGMIAKVPHSWGWQVSRKGHQLLGAVVPPYHYRLPAAITRAA